MTISYAHQLTRPYQALQYEEAVKQALLLDIIADLGFDIQLTRNENGYSINYIDGKNECSTAVSSYELTAWLRRFLSNRIHVKKPTRKKS